MKVALRSLKEMVCRWGGRGVLFRRRSLDRFIMHNFPSRLCRQEKSVGLVQM
jgi:hypothetical protein